MTAILSLVGAPPRLRIGDLVVARWATWVITGVTSYHDIYPAVGRLFFTRDNAIASLESIGPIRFDSELEAGERIVR